MSNRHCVQVHYFVVRYRHIFTLSTLRASFTPRPCRITTASMSIILLWDIDTYLPLVPWEHRWHQYRVQSPLRPCPLFCGKIYTQTSFTPRPCQIAISSMSIILSWDIHTHLTFSTLGASFTHRPCPSATASMPIILWWDIYTHLPLIPWEYYLLRDRVQSPLRPCPLFVVRYRHWLTLSTLRASFTPSPCPIATASMSIICCEIQTHT